MNLAKNATTVALVEKDDRPCGVQLVHTDRTNVAADPMDLVELARVVQKADEFTRANASNKLLTIAEQIRYLQEQARTALEDAKRDNELHHAACNIKKRPGQTYYLYKRQSGQKYFSILSPQEWGKSCPHEYIACYRLEHDMSWTPEEDMKRRSQEIGLIDQLLTSQASLTCNPYPNFQGLLQVKDSKMAQKQGVRTENNN
ncbi:uncharacterized protein C1orf50 homolog isoform X2 [Patiria miniata]|uniref:Uncharacterized protein n=1 Tax=Patiria miniata TaxID=46514 RepID=A0A914BQJ6_PATMI|nr:uncharacterized protein C1orf50 homolog isoform X2 [Patiria miniata]